MKPGESTIKQIYHALHLDHGDQGWWPGDSRFEIMVGAILTQNTNWRNVEKALLNLKGQGLLDPRSIIDSAQDRLARVLQPSGYFNIKAVRLKNYCAWYLEQGAFETLRYLDTTELRTRLLRINGIGPETADSILLYAFQRPIFVIDQYTRRILRRAGCINGDEAYDDLRTMVERKLGLDVAVLNEFHALIVAHAKTHCRKKPLCDGCALNSLCAKSI